MACCLTAPSHYLNQCWLITRGVLWHTSESSFAGIAQGIDSGYEFEKDILKNIFKSPRGQWVNRYIRSLPNISYNELVKSKDTDVPISRLNYSVKNKNTFLSLLRCVDWQNVYLSHCTQSSFTFIHNKLRELHDKCFPLEHSSMKYNSRKPWLSMALGAAIKKKNKLYYKSIKVKSLQNKLYYKSYRNRLKHLLKAAENKILQWSGELSLLKMAINMTNTYYLSFFLWNELEPRCQQRAAGSLELWAGVIMRLRNGVTLTDIANIGRYKNTTIHNKAQTMCIFPLCIIGCYYVVATNYLMSINSIQGEAMFVAVTLYFVNTMRPHIYVSELAHCWLRFWLVAYTAPSHNLT